MFHQLIFNPLCPVFMHIFWHSHIYIYICVCVCVCVCVFVCVCVPVIVFSVGQWETVNRHTHMLTLVVERQYTTYTHNNNKHWPIKNDWIHNGHEYLLHSLVILVLIPLPCIIIGKLLIAPSKDAWNESSVCNSVRTAAVMDKFIFWWATNSTTTKPRNLVNISNPPYQIQRNIIR